jgi:hypothetical protein
LTNAVEYDIIIMSRGEGELKPRKKSPHSSMRTKCDKVALRIVSQKIFEEISKTS